MPSSESLALRNLRTTLRVAAEDLRDLEARIKYVRGLEADAFNEAAAITRTLANEITGANLEREDR